MEKYYLIGEVAKIFGLSADTLRHYDKIGLLKPIKLKNKIYRYYSEKHFDLLYMIQSLRLLDISLEDIKNILYDKDMTKLENSLEKQEEHIENEIKNLKMMQENIKTLKSRIHNLNRDKNRIILKECPEMWAVTAVIDNEVNNFNYKDMMDINEEVDSQWASLSDFVFFIGKSELLDRSFEYGKFGMISKYKCGLENCNLEYIPRKQYVFSLYKGNSIDIGDTYLKMIDWIDNNGYLIDGDAIEKSIISLYDNEDENEHVIEIWIPIIKS